MSRILSFLGFFSVMVGLLAGTYQKIDISPAAIMVIGGLLLVGLDQILAVLTAGYGREGFYQERMMETHDELKKINSQLASRPSTPRREFD